MSRSRQEKLPPNYIDIRYDFLNIDFIVGGQILRMIHSLNNMDKDGLDGFTSRGSIEHIPHQISKGIIEIDSFVETVKKEYKPNEAISADDLEELKSATDKLRSYKYPNIEKDEYNSVINYKDIINNLNSELRPIIEEIIKIYKKYLPENDRTWYHRDEEDVKMVSDEEGEGSGQTSRASVGGRRRKYRKKRTKKRRKSRRKKRRRKRTRKRRKKRR